ncbi:MAG: MFS transporter, partial [Planctomycetes bacterium]|nr:MFS transporter [Planctomycetota bacterium]
LYGGYLTDRLGRRFVLTWSILLYAFSAFFAGFSTNIWMLLIFRCTTFIGVCVEFVAAVAWLAELFPDHKQRERVLGYTQAFSSIGGLLVAVAAGFAAEFSGKFWGISMPDFLVGFLGKIEPEHQHEAWRYTLMSGLIPAIPLILIRPFLPESPVWAEKKSSGSLRRPSIRELFEPKLRRTTIVTTIMFACSYGAAFGAIQQLPQIVPGLADVQEKAKAAGDKAVAAAAEKAKAAAEKVEPGAEKAELTEEQAKVAAEKKAEVAKKVRIGAQRQYETKIAAEYTKIQEIGGLIGRFLLAIMALRIFSRRNLLRLFQGPGLILVPLVFAFFLKVENRTFFEINLESIYLGKLPITTTSLGVALAGLVTVAQFSFWGNYLPLVYPVHLRGTGESFAANIGGRMFGTSFALVTSTIVGWLPDSIGSAPLKFAYTSAGVALFVYLIGSIACFYLPEPTKETMSD